MPFASTRSAGAAALEPTPTEATAGPARAKAATTIERSTGIRRKQAIGEKDAAIESSPSMVARPSAAHDPFSSYFARSRSCRNSS